MRTVLLVGVLASLLACGSTPKPEPSTGEPRPSAEPAPGELAQRPEMTVAECESQGTVVGDIGDGAVHRPEFRCPDGEPPIGSVPQGIEGSVCCGR